MFIADTIRLFETHATRAHVMGGRVRRNPVCLERANCFVHRAALFEGVFTHGNVIGMVIVVNVGHWYPETILGVIAQCDAIALTRHVFAHQPHAGKVSVIVHDSGEILAPGTRLEKCRHERWPKRDGFHFVAADKAAVRIEMHLVTDQARHDRASVEVHRIAEFGENRAGGVPHVMFADHA
ncbi:hypothetical protein D3C85_866050 [compost metagenome]